mgnify:CR=1 FL=1
MREPYHLEFTKDLTLAKLQMGAVINDDSHSWDENSLGGALGQVSGR